MALYGNEVCYTPQEVNAFLARFITESEETNWTLAYHQPSTQYGLTVKHNTKPLCFAYEASGSDATRASPWQWFGRSYTSGFPGIPSAFSLTNYYTAYISYPVRAHIIIDDDFLVYVIQNMSNDRCVISGCGEWQGIGEWKDTKGIWASGVNGTYSYGNYIGFFMEGSKSYRKVTTLAISRYEDDEGQWFTGGSTTPAILPLMRGETDGLYHNDELARLRFKHSATTVFMPAVLCHNINGYKPAYQIPKMRACTTELFGVGDIVEYQDHRWIIFPVQSPGGAGVALQLS